MSASQRGPDSASAASFRAALDAAGLNAQSALEALGVKNAAELARLSTSDRITRTEGGGARATLVRLFLLGVGVNEDAATQALALMGLDAAVRAGLVERRGGAIAGLVQISFFEDLLLATDMPERAIDSLRVAADAVMPPGGTTSEVAALAIRSGVRGAVLDVGTGSGALAISLARAGLGPVVATDISERALAFAAFNAALNGVTIELVRGSGVEPVQGRRFALIVSNPPFVIGPSRSLTYRDSGVRGDGFVRGLVRDAAALLEPGGFVQVTADVAHVRCEDWAGRLRSWVEGLACDSVVLRGRSWEAQAYAEFWLGLEAADSGAPVSLARRKEWIDALASERIEGITHVHMTLRKHAPSAGRDGVMRIETLPAAVAPGTGSVVARFFACMEFSVSATDTEIVGASLRPAPEIRLTQEIAPGSAIKSAPGRAGAAGGWAAVDHRLALAHGLSPVRPIDANTFNLVRLFDGMRTVGEIVQLVAQQARAPAEQVGPMIVQVVRQLVQAGVLLPKGVA
ncbi:MAG: methyltransferase [Planctomycetota bacterium]|nr:methyltransferase [Planctomycetota bacterium]